MTARARISSEAAGCRIGVSLVRLPRWGGERVRRRPAVPGRARLERRHSRYPMTRVRTDWIGCACHLCANVLGDPCVVPPKPRAPQPAAVRVRPGVRVECRKPAPLIRHRPYHDSLDGSDACATFPPARWAEQWVRVPRGHAPLRRAGVFRPEPARPHHLGYVRARPCESVSGETYVVPPARPDPRWAEQWVRAPRPHVPLRRAGLFRPEPARPRHLGCVRAHLCESVSGETYVVPPARPDPRRAEQVRAPRRHAPLRRAGLFRPEPARPRHLGCVRAHLCESVSGETYVVPPARPDPRWAEQWVRAPQPHVPLRQAGLFHPEPVRLHHLGCVRARPCESVSGEMCGRNRRSLRRRFQAAPRGSVPPASPTHRARRSRSPESVRNRASTA